MCSLSDKTFYFGGWLRLYLLLELSIMMRLLIKSENCLQDSLLIQLLQISLLRQIRLFLLAQRSAFSFIKMLL